MAKMCSYCGVRVATTHDHVFPRGLYPKSKSRSTVNRLTIPACLECNKSFSDDEVHFRNVLAVAGDRPNDARVELWTGPIARSFEQPDGRRRVRALLNCMQSFDFDGEERFKVYPAKDPRVVRVVKKVIRGLNHHHGLATAIPETHIWVDVLKFILPDRLRTQMSYSHREKDVAEYYFDTIESDELHSGWVIKFFGTVEFVGAVFRSEDAAVARANAGD